VINASQAAAIEGMRKSSIGTRYARTVGEFYVRSGATSNRQP